MDLSIYLALMSDFIDGRLSADDFSLAYIQQFKRQSEPLSESAFRVLDVLFGDCDTYSPARLRGPENLDEQQLRAAVIKAREQLGS